MGCCVHSCDISVTLYRQSLGIIPYVGGEWWLLASFFDEETKTEGLSDLTNVTEVSFRAWIRKY